MGAQGYEVALPGSLDPGGGRHAVMLVGRLQAQGKLLFQPAELLKIGSGGTLLALGMMGHL